MNTPTHRRAETTNTPVQTERVQIAIVILFVAAYAAILGTATRSTDLTWTIAAAAREGLRIDPNQASAAELELLPGIGPALAGNIIKHRTVSEGRFEQPSDLDAVARIGPAIVDRIAPFLRFDRTTPRTDSP